MSLLTKSVKEWFMILIFKILYTIEMCDTSSDNQRASVADASLAGVSERQCVAESAQNDLLAPSFGTPPKTNELFPFRSFMNGSIKILTFIYSYSPQRQRPLLRRLPLSRASNMLESASTYSPDDQNLL